MELKFQGQHKDPAPPPTIINKEEEYKVEEVWKYRIGKAMGMNMTNG